MSSIATMRSLTVALVATVLMAAGPVTIASSNDQPLRDAARQGDVDAVVALLRGGADVNGAAGDGMTALHWAASSGHAEVAMRLLGAGADPDPTTRIGQHTPLHLAGVGGHVDVMRVLIEAGSDVNATTTSSGVTPLHLAAKSSGGAPAVRLLLEHGAAVDVPEISSGQTPLMFAAAYNRADAVRALLDHGADASLQTKVIDVLRSSAVDREASQVLRGALDSYRESAEAGRDWEPTLDQAQAAILVQRAFLQSGEALPDFDPASLTRSGTEYSGGPPVEHPPYRETLVGRTGGMTALLHAAREGQVEAAVALIEGGADVNQVSGGDQTSALLIASLNGQFDVAMALAEHGADPSLAASTDGAAPLFAVLQTQWAPKSNYPQPRAHDSQQTGYLELLSAMLDAGAEPNVRLNTHLWYWEYGLTKIGTDLRGATAFWRAAYAQDLEAMKMLVAHGADPNIPTEWPAVGMRERRQQDGRQQEDSGLPWVPEGAPNAYPLHAAAGGGFTGLGSFSVRNVPDNFIATVEYLLDEHGADINLLDSWGYTPLHYAASRGDNEMIQFLVDRGADVSVITRLGQSTADIARGGRAGFFLRVAFPETVDLLQSLGSTFECLHTHFLDTGDFCPKAGMNDPWIDGPGGATRYPAPLAGKVIGGGGGRGGSGGGPGGSGVATGGRSGGGGAGSVPR